MTGTLVPPSAAADRAFCDAMLPKVSRTFAICIRLLPSDLEHPVLVAYLLCRVADTIEDTPDITRWPGRRGAEHQIQRSCQRRTGPRP
jgi:farnesyl-diphosphate farnesyltransferase